MGAKELELRSFEPHFNQAMNSSVSSPQPNAIPNAPKILYVNPAEGPLTTLTAAKAAARSGDTIVVAPGTYLENDLLKDGVNWFFSPGAIVSYSPPPLQ